MSKKLFDFDEYQRLQFPVTLIIRFHYLMLVNVLTNMNKHWAYNENAVLFIVSSC